MQALKLSGGRPGLLVIILTLLAGVISMLVDNVVTILMMARWRCRSRGRSSCHRCR